MTLQRLISWKVFLWLLNNMKEKTMEEELEIDRGKGCLMDIDALKFHWVIHTERLQMDIEEL
jgi:hypothetical protein